MTTDLVRQTDTPRDVAVTDPEATAALTHYLGTGDLSQLTGPQRAALYTRTCESLGINSLTRPFDWIEFYDPETKGKKLVLYPSKSCADQLAYQHRIRVEVVEEKIVGSLFKVVVKGTMPNGRTETNVSYLDLTDRDGNQLRGQRLGNAFMKGHTKAKRRLVFGMVGLMAPPDVEDLAQARIMTVDGGGNVLDHPTEEQRHLADRPTVARAIGAPTFETTAATADWPDGAEALDGMPDQRPRPEDLEAPKDERPRPTLKASDDDVKRWLGAWFGSVKGLSLDSDEARARFVAQWTREWPKERQTDSLRTMFRRMTAEEAGDFLGHVRALMEGERRELLAAAAEGRGPSGDPVADAVLLTGGPAPDDDETEEAF